MTQEHPIKPPLVLVDKWFDDAPQDSDDVGVSEYVATQAACWGADAELEACCEWVYNSEYCQPHTVLHLRSARRPTPPSLKEQALQALDLLKVDASTHGLGFDSSAIRRALESLPE